MFSCKNRNILKTVVHFCGNRAFYLKRQVFRVFCDDITETGLLDMLRVVKINLKGRQTDSDDEDSGRVDIEDDDETVMEDAEVGEIDDVADDLDEDMEDDSTDEGDADQDDLKDGEKAEANKDGDDSDDSDGMDDVAMFRIDPYIARIFKERNLPGSETKQSQLMRFKLRVLTLLDIYLQRNPGIF